MFLPLKEKEKRKRSQILPQAKPDTSRPRWSLRADDLAGPGLVLRSRVQVCDDHLHCLHLLVLGWDGTHFICHLVPLHGNVLALDAALKRNGLFVIERNLLSKHLLMYRYVNPRWLPELIDSLWDVDEDVFSTVSGFEVSVTLWPREVLTHALKHRTRVRPHRSGVRGEENELILYTLYTHARATL